MNLATIEHIVPELRNALIGRRFGKVFVLSPRSIAIDFRLPDSKYLYISVESALPRVYLIRRRLRDLEKASGNPTAFTMQMKKRVSSAEVFAVDQFPGERILELAFIGSNELGEPFRASILIQLTGKSANLFLLDEQKRIVDSLRETPGNEQQIGEIYKPPVGQPPGPSRANSEGMQLDGFETISDSLDAADLERQAEADSRSTANAARAQIARENAKLEKLL